MDSVFGNGYCMCIYVTVYVIFFYYFDYFYNFGGYIIKQDKRKRNVISEADGKHTILPLKIFLKLKENDERQ